MTVHHGTPSHGWSALPTPIFGGVGELSTSDGKPSDAEQYFDLPMRQSATLPRVRGSNRKAPTTAATSRFPTSASRLDPSRSGGPHRCSASGGGRRSCNHHPRSTGLGYGVGGLWLREDIQFPRRPHNVRSEVAPSDWERGRGPTPGAPEHTGRERRGNEVPQRTTARSGIAQSQRSRAASTLCRFDCVPT